MNPNVPNLLTMFRIVIIPFFIASFYLDAKLYHWVAAFLFLLAGITDFFDGYLARMMRAQSALGTFLDPIADKLLVATAILMLIHFNQIGTYDIIPAIAIIGRELLISGLREFLAGVSVSVPVTNLAKIKTAIQMIAIFSLLWSVEGPNIDLVQQSTDIHFTDLVGRLTLWIAALLTVITGYAYLKAGLKHMKDEQAGGINDL